MAHTNVKNMTNTSPLGCCIPKDDRNLLNPVFKQQYVNESGKIKMTMPLSPMHYISNANYYANDVRYPPMRWENAPVQYQHYDYPVSQHSHIKQVDVDKDKFDGDDYTIYNNRRVITPSMSFINQLQRNASVHTYTKPPHPVHVKEAKANNVEYRDTKIDVILSDIDTKLSKILSVCDKNKEEINKLLSLMNPDELKSTKHEEAVYDIQKETLKTHESLLGKFPHVINVEKEKTFDRSKELKVSNDILEEFVRDGTETIKTNHVSVENKITEPIIDDEIIADVIEPENNESLAVVAKETDGNILSNIEKSFKRLMSSFEYREEDEILDDTLVDVKEEQSQQLSITGNPPEPMDEDKLYNLFKFNGKLDLTRRIKDLNLSEMEIKYLRAHKYIKDDENVTIEDIKLTCDLLPGSRATFEDLIQQDSIHGLNSMQIE